MSQAKEEEHLQSLRLKEYIKTNEITCAIKLDHLLGKYYERCGAKDYFDSKGDGKLLQFIITRKLSDFSLAKELGSIAPMPPMEPMAPMAPKMGLLGPTNVPAIPLDLHTKLLTNFDPQFPIYSDLMTVSLMRGIDLTQYLTFCTVQYCYVHNSLPSKQTLLEKAQERLTMIESVCDFCGILQYVCYVCYMCWDSIFETKRTKQTRIIGS